MRRIPSPADYDDATDPHDRGAILVAAVFDAFLQIYKRRTRDLLRLATGGTEILAAGAIPPDLVNRLAQEASKIAGHILNMCIRALDYCPPVDLTFGEYLRALITADTDLVPLDEHRYRTAFIAAFRDRGIYPPDVKHLSPDSLVWEPPAVPLRKVRNVLDRMSIEWDLNIDRQNAEHLSQQNAKLFWHWLHNDPEVSDEEIAALGLVRVDRPGPYRLGSYAGELRRIEVHSVRPARRADPEGVIHWDVVVELTQTFRPADLPGARFRGGCTLLINFGSAQVRYVVRKRVGQCAANSSPRGRSAAPAVRATTISPRTRSASSRSRPCTACTAKGAALARASRTRLRTKRRPVRAPAAPGWRAKVRMYRQGLGDCFLVSMPRAGSRPYSIMIDCGVILGTPDAAARMEAVVDNIVYTTQGEIDLLVVTHEHWDHVSGFVQAEASFGRLKVHALWLAWTEDPEHELAKKLRRERRSPRCGSVSASCSLRAPTARWRSQASWNSSAPRRAHRPPTRSLRRAAWCASRDTACRRRLRPSCPTSAPGSTFSARRRTRSGCARSGRRRARRRPTGSRSTGCRCSSPAWTRPAAHSVGANHRRQLAECHYHPENLKQFMKRDSSPPLAITKRVPTGMPCPPMQ
jgi:hypothetical protein